jgi:purine-cytosine permease-like protein
LITAIGNAYADHQVIFVLGMAVFVAAGAWDEYYYHREIPGEESDLHAKEHFGLFTFVVVTLSTSWLEAHQWQFSELLPGRK